MKRELHEGIRELINKQNYLVNLVFRVLRSYQCINNEQYQSNGSIVGHWLLHNVGIVVGICILARLRVLVSRSVQEVSCHTTLPFDLDLTTAGKRISFLDQNIAHFPGNLYPVQYTRGVHSGCHIYGIAPDVVLRFPGTDHTGYHLRNLFTNSLSITNGLRLSITESFVFPILQLTPKRG